MLLGQNTLTLDTPETTVENNASITRAANKTTNAYHALKDINEVDPLTDEDHETLQMVREVLRKRNAIDKFGVSLLHDHFEVNEDEILLETHDPISRTLTVKPYRNESLKEADIDDDGFMQTNWRFDQDDPKNLLCMVYCTINHAPEHRGAL
ncbi:hypothetical protein [Microscilla marina]|uniref:Uncharacterized protein n=1 Tax=Microscilla marina ATCC 23134 TaxID=313606 RepID=A1ZZR7_MICM2|nr:hypothetical protein [Microscilla marina]EAY24125.1 hypothetical protein M23134_06042 [Microscilla marina ATCC 23134]